ncbi:MAG: restriction endonuclease, partial [Methanosarcinales archaeon]
FLKIPDSEGTNWSRMWHLAQSAPANIAFKTGTRVAVIIDEFQRMDECIYDDKAKTILNKSYTGSYSGLSESKEAPMLVSGSVVSVLKRKVFGGGLRGRVGWMPFGLLSIEDTTLLAFKLSDKTNIPVTIESARLIAEISGGNPFYVWAAFNSLKEDKDLTTAKGVERVYLHEVTSKSGWIREFWEEHFERNMALLNDDPPDKFGLTKKIILYVLKNKDREIPFTEIAEKFNISETYAYHKINDLLEMDLVESDAWGIVQGLKDNMLQRCLIAKFKPIIDNIDKIKVQKEIESDLELENQRLKSKIKSLQSQINNMLGKEAELMLRRVMSAFKNQIINGKYFNQDKDVQLTKFDRAPTSIQSGGYQIDLYAKKETSTQKIIWIVESKNWEGPSQVGSANVKEFIEKITVVKNTENPKALIGWFYSKSGFTNEAIYLLKQNNILYSTQSDVVDLITELKI